MSKPNSDVRSFYVAYLEKRLRPETALAVASGFVFDLVNAFGDVLDANTPLKDGWVQFAPSRFLLELNAVLSRFREAGGGLAGYDALTDIERSLLADSGLLLGSLVSYSLDKRESVEASDEELFQIPISVADDLRTLVRQV